MSRMLADMNVPEEYVSTLRGDGHDVVYSRAALGPEATDDAIVAYVASEGMAIINTSIYNYSCDYATISTRVSKL